MTTMYVDGNGILRERLMTPEMEAEREAAERVAAGQPRPLTAQEQAEIEFFKEREKMNREARQEEARMLADQQAGQQAILAELRALLNPALEQAVRDTQATLHAAQGEVQQQRAAIERHEHSRPGLGATPADIRGWSGEKALLGDMLETYTRNEATAAAAHQAAVQRLQAAVRQMYAQRRAQMQQAIDVEWRNDMVKVDAAKAEVDRLMAAAQAAHGLRQQELNRLDRYWPRQ